MSNADAGWIYPNQQHGLTRQLEDGVRAMMLDTYLWEGEPFLCHGYCELGAQPLAEGLGELATFLDDNPGEVLAIIFQDALSVDQTVAVLDEVGLAELAFSWEDAADATLGELIDADQRLLLSAESGAPPPTWYHQAWQLWQDTPYSFESRDDFSCEPYRGQADSPLFLVNHWISDPLPQEDNAAVVNQAEVLEARARRCAEERGRPVNYLAVDFYAVGDLFAVVDRLNGVDE